MVQPKYKEVVLFTSDTLCFALTRKQLFFNGQHHSINEVQADRGDVSPVSEAACRCLQLRQTELLQCASQTRLLHLEMAVFCLTGSKFCLVGERLGNTVCIQFNLDVGLLSLGYVKMNI